MGPRLDFVGMGLPGLRSAAASHLCTRYRADTLQALHQLSSTRRGGSVSAGELRGRLEARSPDRSSDCESRYAPWKPEPGYGDFEGTLALTRAAIDLIGRCAQAVVP